MRTLYVRMHTFTYNLQLCSPNLQTLALNPEGRLLYLCVVSHCNNELGQTVHLHVTCQKHCSLVCPNFVASVVALCWSPLPWICHWSGHCPNYVQYLGVWPEMLSFITHKDTSPICLLKHWPINAQWWCVTTLAPMLHAPLSSFVHQCTLFKTYLCLLAHCPCEPLALIHVRTCAQWGCMHLV